LPIDELTIESTIDDRQLIGYLQSPIDANRQSAISSINNRKSKTVDRHSAIAGRHSATR
jgi:GR25 family glycosyltransferase involved in LPS biosynthesis